MSVMQITTFGPEGDVVTSVAVVEEAQPLDRESQLVALLAAKGVVTTREASDLTGHSEEKLTAEVEAWAVAAEDTRKR